MQHKNVNVKKRIEGSSHNSANRFRCASAHCEQADSGKATICANRTRRSQDTNLYSRIAGWSIVVLTMFGLFGYLTFIPEQVFAEYDWETRALSDITTMQEMNAKICENSSEHETKQLEDTREPGKKYWVAKLKDGNCWMTQNLDFDITDELNEETSNVIGIVDMRKDGQNPRVNLISEWAPDESNTSNQYYDPGDYVYTGNGPGSNANPQPCDSLTSETCARFFQKATLESDSHYHIGNYYTWATATAKTGNDLTTGNASQSICPRGWKLPSSGGVNIVDGTFAYMLEPYGVIAEHKSNYLRLSLTGKDSDNKTYQIYNSPMFFVYAGYFGSVPYIQHVSSNALYWSSTISTQPNIARTLSFGTSGGGISSDNGAGRYIGASVRCINDPNILPDSVSDTATSNVSVTVSPVISIDATSDMTSEVDFTRVSTGSITADISSNQAYQVLLSTTQSTLEQTPILTESNIPMITTDQDITAGTSSWGIKKKLSATTGLAGDTTNATLYSPIGITNPDTNVDNKVLFFKSATAEKRTLDFLVGIAVDPKLPSGTYSTQVTITAVAM